MRFLRILLILVAASTATGFGVWGVLALWYRPPFPAFQIELCALWGAAMLAGLIGLICGWPRRSLALMAIAVTALFAYWSTLWPSNDRDLIRLRTNIRGEDLRLYRLNASPAVARKALLAYVAEANDLADHPRWYDTATTNCTTAVFNIARVVEPGFPLDWRILLSGYFPDYAYDHHALDTSLPFAELRERAKISARAIAADAAPSAEFSRAIRAGVPGAAGAP